MYNPQSFVETDLLKLHDFITQHSFATLVTGGDPEPYVSHLPLLLDRDRGPQGTLVGHMARANSHGRGGSGRESVALFHGPHAYISPAWYEEPQTVPTWNYVAVHAHGRLRVIDDLKWLRAHLSRMVDRYESGRLAPWRLADQEAAFIDRLLGSIVGFEIPIDTLHGKWKLSQNHSIERRERVVRRLQEEATADSQAIAALMAAGLDSDR
jgi:transcriptional regulator